MPHQIFFLTRTHYSLSYTAAAEKQPKEEGRKPKNKVGDAGLKPTTSVLWEQSNVATPLRGLCKLISFLKWITHIYTY